jgi:hypothetical protein
LYCPVCADEFQAGVEVCDRCGVALAKQPRVTAHGHDEPFVRVFQSYDEFEFDIVKGFLRAHGIPFVTTGDPAAEFGMRSINRMPTLDEPAGMQLFVPPLYAEQTEEILARAGKGK